MPRDYHQLKVFQLADELVLRIYQVTKSFPRDEVFGLTSQIRRAAVSVPGNIVEGAGRESEKDFRRHISIAYGSLAEVGYYIDLSKRLGRGYRIRASRTLRRDESNAQRTASKAEGYAHRVRPSVHAGRIETHSSKLKAQMS